MVALPDPKITETYLRALLPGDVPDGHRLNTWTLKDKVSAWHASVDEALAWVSRTDLTKTDAYVGMATVTADAAKRIGRNGRTSIEDAAAIFGYRADLDVRGPTHDDPNLPATREEAIEKVVRKIPLAPTLLINTGTGVHAYWLFNEPLIIESDEERAEAKARAWRWNCTIRFYVEANGWKHDNVSDLARVMRLAGTLNLCKGKADPRPTTILEHNPTARYEPDDFDPFLLDDAAERDDLDPTTIDLGKLGGFTLDLDAELSEERIDELCQHPAAGRLADRLLDRRDGMKPTAGFSEVCLSIASSVARAGGTVQEACDLIVMYRRNHADDMKHPSAYKLTLQKAFANRHQRIEQAREADGALGEAMQRCRDDGDVRHAFNAAPDLAKIDRGEREVWINRFAQVLGRALRVGELRREIRHHLPKKPKKTVASTKPKVDVGGDWQHLIENAAGLLKWDGKGEPWIFQRSGPVRLTADEHGRTIIAQATDVFIKGEMGRRATFVVQTEKGEVAVAPPSDVARDLLCRFDSELAPPPLLGITNVPTLRPDGTILAKPGYDRDTGLVYAPAPGFTFPHVPDRPTQADVKAAVDTVLEPLADFPFESQADLANAVGMELTPVLRQFYDLSPLLLIDAPQAGNGKTLLARVAHVIDSGEDAEVQTLPDTDDELRKLITSLLIRGSTSVIFDNADNAVSHSSLARLITAPRWSDRRLGASETVSLRNTATWHLTGNNVSIAGDMIRRTVRIRIDAKTARPWSGERQFRHPELIKWTIANRGKLVAALLTLCKAWIAAGRPNYGPPRLGSFERWCSTVGNVLAHAGIAGFLANREELYAEADTEGPAWAAFLNAWQTKYDDKDLTVAQLADDVCSDDDLREALPDDLAGFIEIGGVDHHGNPQHCIRKIGPFKIRLGKALKHRVGRRFGEAGLFIVRGDNDPHTKVGTWRVVAADETHSPQANRPHATETRFSGSVRGVAGSVSNAACRENAQGRTGTRNGHVRRAHVSAREDGRNVPRNSPHSPQDSGGEDAETVVGAGYREVRL